MVKQFKLSKRQGYRTLRSRQSFGDFLFASGQVPLSPETGDIVGETIEEQTKQVLSNVKAF